MVPSDPPPRADENQMKNFTTSVVVVVKMSGNVNGNQVNPATPIISFQTVHYRIRKMCYFS